LERAAQGCVAVALLMPPFLLGGRCALAQLILACLASLAAGCCLVRRWAANDLSFSWRAPEFALPAGALALGFLTWMPLPPTLVRALAPGIGRLLPAWTDGSLTGLGGSGWSHLSLCPGLSREATLLFVVYAMLFWTSLACLRRPAAAESILKILFLSGVSVAVIGLGHYWFGKGKYYGFWQPWWVQPEHQVRAPFTNRNHFAGYLVLSLPPGMLWLGQQCRRTLVPSTGEEHPSLTLRASVLSSASELGILFTGAALALVLVALVLAQSRAGTVLALVTSLMATAAVGWYGWLAFAVRDTHRHARKDAPIAQHPGKSLLLGAPPLVGAAALALVLTLQQGSSFQRLYSSLADGQSVDQLTNHRLQLWQADLHALLDFPLFGSGAGSHSYVWPLYLERSSFNYTHAENCYLQILVECGLLGATLLGFAVVVLGRRLFAALGRDQAHYNSPRLLAAIVATSLATALVHAFVDFVWYVPVYATAVVVLCAIACSFASLHGTRAGREQSTVRSRSRHRLAPSALAVIGLVLTVAVLGHFIRYAEAEAAWYSYYTLVPSRQARAGQGFGVDENRLLPMPSSQESQTGSSVREHLDQRARYLRIACRQRAADPEYYYRLGLIAEEQFALRAGRKSLPQTVLALRQALEAKSFASAEEKQHWLATLYDDDLAWLHQAQACFRRALHGCPLLGKAYLHLADLSFLDKHEDQSPAYCRQALAVRPNDASVCLQAGLEGWVEGDYSMARQCWRRACRLAPENRLKLLPVLASQFSPEWALDLTGASDEDPENRHLIEISRLSVLERRGSR
jgi:O-antigen ligase